jgi:uncharacterized protein (TIGR02594 family)
MPIRSTFLLALCSVALPVFVAPAFAAPSRSTDSHSEVAGWLGLPQQPQVSSRRRLARESRGAQLAAFKQEKDPSAPISGTAAAYAGTVDMAAVPARRKKQASAPVQSQAASPAGASAYASAAAEYPSGSSSLAAGSGSSMIAEARRYIGTNPTNRRSLWCGAFMNLVLQRTGHPRGSSDLAKSFASYGPRVSGPQVGAIAVMSRGPSGGHVGIVTGMDPSGNPIILSGNHEGRVAEVPYPRGRIFAYVLPDGSGAGGGKQAGINAAPSNTREN